jgi:hypothetical protein
MFHPALGVVFLKFVSLTYGSDIWKGFLFSSACEEKQRSQVWARGIPPTHQASCIS